MDMQEAVSASQVGSARGYSQKGECVCAVAFYDDQLLMLRGFGGDWEKKWSPITEEDAPLIKNIDFLPFGPKPVDQIEQEIKDAITEIIEDEDDFSPMGESYE